MSNVSQYVSHASPITAATLKAREDARPIQEIYDKAKFGGLEELLRAGVDIDYRGSTGSHARDEVTPAAPSRVADR